MQRLASFMAKRSLSVPITFRINSHKRPFRGAMDEKTARKYRDSRKLPSTLRQPRTYRTRKDPFAEVWPQVEALLRKEPGLQAKTVFDWLRKQPPGKFQASHRRTLERRVRHWRVTCGPAREVMFRQVHQAGDLAASDFTEMNSLGVTIAGERFEHFFSSS